MGLKTKFNLIMLGAFVVGFALAAVMSYNILQRIARDEVVHDARFMMATALAVRSYTVDEIAPLIEDHMSVRFLPHSVPSWAAQTSLRRLDPAYRAYGYREAALNPTNPADQAVEWEAGIIEAFRTDANLKEYVVERDSEAGLTLALARPIRLTDEACLVCHTAAAEAPPAMVDLYGPDRGFGWQLDSVIGAQIVTVPMDVALDGADRAFVLVLSALGSVFIIMMMVLNLLLHWLIARRVRRISELAGEVSMGNMDVPEFDERGKDEIASLGASFNRMRRSLVDVTKLLETN